MTKDKADALVLLVEEMSEASEELGAARLAHMVGYQISAPQHERLEAARQQFYAVKRRVWAAITEATDKE
ncbi:MAG TPA: hypothetical protein VD926_09060 [Acidimicrobiales bacterium]|nr:hypothetical protein [Acidimicrobiales bacterium]